jgi:hypothetical protein
LENANEFDKDMDSDEDFDDDLAVDSLKDALGDTVEDLDNDSSSLKDSLCVDEFVTVSVTEVSCEVDSVGDARENVVLSESLRELVVVLETDLEIDKDWVLL